MIGDLLHWFLSVASTSFIVVKLASHSRQIKKLTAYWIRFDDRSYKSQDTINIDTGGGDININK